MEFTIFICLINDLKLLPQSLFSLLTLPKKMSPWKLRIIQMRIKKERNSEDATCRMYTSGSGLQKYWKSELKNIASVFSLSWSFQIKCPHGSGELFRWGLKRKETLKMQHAGCTPEDAVLRSIEKVNWKLYKFYRRALEKEHIWIP